MPMLRNAIAALLLSTGVAAAGPFGTEMGATPDALGTTIVEGRTFSPITSVPKAHPSFTAYGGKFGPRSGLCVVIAIGDEFRNDRYGSAARKEFEAVALQLGSVYGDSELFDHLKGSALWDDSNEWVMAIRQNERSYQRAWKAGNGSDLKDDIEEILLTVQATSSDSANIHLQYRFSNAEACEAELATASSDAL